jgi:hypothetical protein
MIPALSATTIETQLRAKPPPETNRINFGADELRAS